MGATGRAQRSTLTFCLDSADCRGALVFRASDRPLGEWAHPERRTGLRPRNALASGNSRFEGIVNNSEDVHHRPLQDRFPAGDVEGMQHLGGWAARTWYESASA